MATGTENGQFPDKVYTILDVHGTNCTMQIDTGSTCNVLPEQYLPKGVKLEKSTSKLRMYNKQQLPVLGTANLRVKNPKNGKQYTVKFMVVKLKGSMQKPLIGASTAQNMELIEVKCENLCSPELSDSVHEITLENNMYMK